jgi:outer membrane immunogenic protein
MRANGTYLRSVAVAAGLTAALGAGSAYAADVVYEEPPAPAPIEALPVASWAGPYVGLNFGRGFGGTITGATGGTITGASGWVFGGFAGYNWQAGNFVYGLEGELGYNGVNGNNGTTWSRQGLEGSLRARLGFAATESMLIYATGGGAGTQQRIYDFAGNDMGTVWGWTVGAGVDAKLTDMVFGRVEYRYSDFGSVTLDTGSGPQTVSPSNHRVTVGLGVKF